jgi:hypothetical protein
VTPGSAISLYRRNAAGNCGSVGRRTSVFRRKSDNGFGGAWRSGAAVGKRNAMTSESETTGRRGPSADGTATTAEGTAAAADERLNLSTTGASHERRPVGAVWRERRVS